MGFFMIFGNTSRSAYFLTVSFSFFLFSFVPLPCHCGKIWLIATTEKNC